MKNPSRASKRIVLAVLAASGLAIAVRLAAFQLGLAPAPFEPFFGDGSRIVLSSWLSRALPIPDAALGAAGYAVELTLTVVGGTERWRTRPRLVLLYCGVAMALGAAGVFLAAWQVLAVHAGCTLCLASATISVAIAGLALTEGRAAMRRSTLRAILHGG